MRIQLVVRAGSGLMVLLAAKALSDDESGTDGLSRRRIHAALHLFEATARRAKS
jgi:hypothetical protein